MYLRSIHTENYGPIEQLQYTCKFDDNGNPLPVVLIGMNGCGKTLLITNIIHSIIEFKRKIFSDIQEVNGDNYYRIGSKSYIREGACYSYNNILFDGGQRYTDLMTSDFSTFKEKEYNQETHKNVNINDKNLSEDGFYLNFQDASKSDFIDNIYLYFPVDRYYTPQWFNEENRSPHFESKQNFIGKSCHNMICQNLLSEIEPWLLDVVMDKLLYEEVLANQYKGEQLPKGLSIRMGYAGKNNNIQSQINQFLSEVFSKQYSNVRIGISQKQDQYRKIAIYGTKNGVEQEIVPSFGNLSSGEIMVFSIACKILKEYDAVPKNRKIEDISGIVLIDEIDAHLHSNFANDITPKLIKLFPKIQFIVSSHSPFFLLGMNDNFGEKCQFLHLPNGTILNDIEHFEEIRNCYSLIDNGYEKLEKNYEDYKNRVVNLTKPLIITEGKTDWKHIKNALIRFQEKDEFTDLDVDFYEYDFDMGDRLKNIVSNIKDVPNKTKIIAVFDTDKKIVKEDVPYEKMGNNVYQCAIPDPQNYGCGISVEMMYPEEDIKKLDNNDRRLFLTNEFSTRSGALLSNHSIICRNKTLTDAEKNNRVKIVDFGVIDVETDVNIALSKEDFATNVLNRVPPFDNVNIDGFRSLFETIRQILND